MHIDFGLTDGDDDDDVDDDDDIVTRGPNDDWFIHILKLSHELEHHVIRNSPPPRPPPAAPLKVRCRWWPSKLWFVHASGHFYSYLILLPDYPVKVGVCARARPCMYVRICVYVYVYECAGRSEFNNFLITTAAVVVLCRRRHHRHHRPVWSLVTPAVRHCPSCIVARHVRSRSSQRLRRQIVIGCTRVHRVRHEPPPPCVCVSIASLRGATSDDEETPLHTWSFRHMAI